MKRLYVRPVARARGLERRLAEALIVEARSSGRTSLLLDIPPSMTPAQTLYHSLGFRPRRPYRSSPVPGTRFLGLDLWLTRTWRQLSARAPARRERVLSARGHGCSPGALARRALLLARASRRASRPVDIVAREPRMRIALFVTCIGDTLYPSTGRAVVGILERLGHEVVFPARQTCCGQMHLNRGYRHEAAKLARRFTEIFAPHDLIVSPSSSCVGMIREFHPQLVPEAQGLGARVFELTELLVNRLGVEQLGASFPGRVTYHPTCHSLRVSHIGDAPYRLLRAVAGLELVELPAGDECCGFGGTFAVKNAESSIAILEDKCSAIASTGAEVCTAVDPSCLMQIGGGLSRQARSARTLHIAEILDSGHPG